MRVSLTLDQDHKHFYHAGFKRLATDSDDK